MKVILNEDVYNLGEEGDVCVVKSGYARNFLLPRNLAVPFTKGNLTIFTAKKDQIEKRKEEKRKNAQSLKEKLASLVIEIKVAVGDTGKLFGSISNANIADELAKKGFKIERKNIFLSESHLRMLGEYDATINLYGEEKAIVKIVLVDEKAPAVEAPVADAPATE
ncbi:MAG: 50S ribosomal protein L9, partial [Spirochaetales bacterium]|nr:50S ribosomal protein L9 [Spirochaetales bacterium]